ncbi:MAG: hypothetical protein ACHRXM_24410, partial [Isosphaerales bacterium]
MGARESADDALAEVRRLEAFVSQVLLDILDNLPLEELFPRLAVAGDPAFELRGGGGSTDPE